MRPVSKLWLDHDVPATAVSSTETLSGPGAIEITVPVDYPARRGEDGRALISEWDALLVVEDDAGHIIQAGIVDEVKPGLTSTQVSAGGVSMYPTGMPYEGATKSYVESPAVSVLAYVWSHLQSQPNGALGVTITGSSKVTMGAEASAAWKAADGKRASAQKAYDAAHKVDLDRNAEVKSLWVHVFHDAGMTYIGTVTKSKSAPTKDQAKVVWVNTSEHAGPSPEGTFHGWDRTKKTWVRKDTAATTYEAWKAANAAYKAAQTAQTTAKTALDAAKDALSKLDDQAADPYGLTWWQTQDLGQVVTDVVTAGVEYLEETVWAGDDLAHRIVCRDEGTGPRRDDLRFEIGVNVTSAPELARAVPYTEVLVVGAGEGSSTLRQSAAVPAGGRVRRVQVIADQDARTKQLVAAKSAAALKKIQPPGAVQLSQLTVADHPYARWTQYGVGDLIRVVGTLPGGIDVDAWVRVTERTFDGSTDIATLKVEMA